jgi:hypothetical protein
MTESLPHLATDFFTWLWWTTEENGGRVNVDGEEIILWVDDRMAFRLPSEDVSRAVLTGADTARAAEAKAAMAAGKILKEVRLRLQWADREYGFTLKSPGFDVGGLVLPPLPEEGDEQDRLLIRMEAIEALWAVLGAIYRKFADLRTSDNWEKEVVPTIQKWLIGQG